ncbi:MAG: PorP/SprF family type IX secretion system membrane protein [Prevotellaceae bacterium]|jgi:type IX secretion system PorP/SprF family membrane protein|nr:PorP/SprF family type IX secretion system membrane protein [Prevotellaceae bacterium]
MKRRIFFVALLMPCLLLSRAFAQQEVQLSQYMFNGLTLNPAMAGSQEALNVQLSYRKQWMGFEGAPSSQVGSIDGSLGKGKGMGWGLLVLSEQMGLMSTMGAYFNYSFRIRLNEMGDRLSFGLAGGIAREDYKGVEDGSDLYDLDDEALLPNAHMRPDFRFGLYYNYGKSFYLSASATNLGSLLGADTLSIINPYACLGMGLHFYLGSMRLSPAAMLRYSLNEAPVLDVNLAATFAGRLWVGVGLRTALPVNAVADAKPSNAAVLMAEVWITPLIRLGYSYDYALGRTSGVHAGSHEVSLGFTMRKTLRVAKYFSSGLWQ